MGTGVPDRQYYNDELEQPRHLNQHELRHLNQPRHLNQQQKIHQFILENNDDILKLAPERSESLIARTLMAISTTLEPNEQQYAKMALHKILQDKGSSYLEDFLTYLNQAWQIFDILENVPESRNNLLPENKNLSSQELIGLYLTNSLFNAGTAYEGDNSVACIKGIAEGALASFEHIFKDIHKIFEPARLLQAAKDSFFLYQLPLFFEAVKPNFLNKWKQGFKEEGENFVNKGLLDKEEWDKFKTWVSVLKDIQSSLNPKERYKETIQIVFGMKGVHADDKLNKSIQEALDKIDIPIDKKNFLDVISEIKNDLDLDVFQNMKEKDFQKRLVKKYFFDGFVLSEEEIKEATEVWSHTIKKELSEKKSQQKRELYQALLELLRDQEIIETFREITDEKVNDGSNPLDNAKAFLKSKLQKTLGKKRYPEAVWKEALNKIYTDQLSPKTLQEEIIL